LFCKIDINSISQVMLLYEWANRTTGEIFEVMANIVASNFQWTKKYGSTRFRGNTSRNKKHEATEADEILMVDDNEYYKDIESDDSDEEFKDTGKHAYPRSYSTRNTKTNQDEYEERSPDVKRKSNSPALSANKKMKSQGIHEKNKSGVDIDRKMPAAQLPLANIKTEDQDDWKKDIQEMSKAIKGLVEAQVKTNEKMSKLEKQIAKEEEDKEDKEDYVQDDKKETPEK
jgi:hypothetical protein